MKKLLKPTAVVLTISLFAFFIQSWSADKTKRDFYRLTVYHFNSATQEKTLDNYLQNALLPALHKLNIKNIGVFKNHSNDTLADKTLYVSVPMQSLDDVINVPGKLLGNKEHNAAGAEYID